MSFHIYGILFTQSLDTDVHKASLLGNSRVSTSLTKIDGFYNNIIFRFYQGHIPTGMTKPLGRKLSAFALYQFHI